MHYKYKNLSLKKNIGLNIVYLTMLYSLHYEYIFNMINDYKRPVKIKNKNKTV